MSHGWTDFPSNRRFFVDDYHYSVYSQPEKGPDVGQVITILIKLSFVAAALTETYHGTGYS